LLAAYIAREGFTGARRILEGDQGMAAAMTSDPDPTKLTERLGERWAVLETSFKNHACCRHTHPAADALLQGMREHGLRADDIARVRARVHRAAIDVLGPVTDPQTIHQSKFSMGFVLALIAVRGSAGVTDFTHDALAEPALRELHDKVEMVFDREVDAAYPERWIGLVEVETVGGERLTSRVEVPKGDPGNPLSRPEIEDKLRRLVAFGGGASPAEAERVIDLSWNLDQEAAVGRLLLGTEYGLQAA
jgi:2-methylcitrate dehydratase PrpD